MRIQFAIEGGFAAFPGLSRPVTIDTGRLPGSTGRELEDLVEAAHFFQQPAEIPALPGAADYRQYVIAVDDGSRTHEIRVAEPIADPALRQLVASLREASRRQRTSADGVSE